MATTEGPLTLEQLPSDEQLAADESGMTYRTLFFRLLELTESDGATWRRKYFELWLVYKEQLKLQRALLESKPATFPHG